MTCMIPAYLAHPYPQAILEDLATRGFARFASIVAEAKQLGYTPEQIGEAVRNAKPTSLQLIAMEAYLAGLTVEKTPITDVEIQRIELYNLLAKPRRRTTKSKKRP